MQRKGEGTQALIGLDKRISDFPFALRICRIFIHAKFIDKHAERKTKRRRERERRQRERGRVGGGWESLLPSPKLTESVCINNETRVEASWINKEYFHVYGTVQGQC